MKLIKKNNNTTLNRSLGDEQGKILCQQVSSICSVNCLAATAEASQRALQNALSIFDASSRQAVESRDLRSSDSAQRAVTKAFGTF